MPSNIKTFYDLLTSGPLIRGTPEWDARERARQSIGCRCLSFGSLQEALSKERDERTCYLRLKGN